MSNFDLRETRRLRLQQLIDERFNGSQTDFAIAAKKSAAQVNHWLSGYRNPNGDTCRAVEKALLLTRDWLDQPNNTPAQAGPMSGTASIKITATGTLSSLSNLQAVVENLHPNVQSAGRDVLRRWTLGEMDTEGAAQTLDAFDHVSHNMKLADSRSSQATKKDVIGNHEKPDFL